MRARSDDDAAAAGGASDSAVGAPPPSSAATRRRALLGMSGRPRPDLETPHPLTMLKQLLASGGTPVTAALGGVLAEVERQSTAPRRHAALLAAAPSAARARRSSFRSSTRAAVAS